MSAPKAESKKDEKEAKGEVKVTRVLLSPTHLPRLLPFPCHHAAHLLAAWLLMLLPGDGDMVVRAWMMEVTTRC